MLAQRAQRGRRGTAALGFAALFGCARQANEPGPSARPDPAELDRLRALPYVGFVDTDGRGETGVVLRDPARSYRGYSLYAIQMLSMAELIDETGTVVRSWHHAPSARWEHAELLPNGDLLAIGAGPPGIPDLPPDSIPDDTRYVLRLDWSGRLLWKRYLRAHHDIELTPGGKLLVLTFERRRVPAVHREIDTRDDQLTLLAQDGQVLDSLSLLDAFLSRPEVFALQPVGPSALGVVPWIDLFHANSVEWIDRPELRGRHPMFEPGNVLVCLRHQNCVAVVSWPRRELVWAWGAHELLGPHDACLLDSGHILVFDNGVGRGWSRVVELDPLNGRIVWEHRARRPEDFYTISKGSSQRLPNGNTLIANSDSGTAFEVTPNGETVWAFTCPHELGAGRRAAIVRMERFGRDLVDGLIARP